MNIYTGLLFQHGHIADARLAVSLATVRPAPDGAEGEAPAHPGAPFRSTRDASRDPSHHQPRRQAMNLFQTLMFLGGRPMTAGHNDDIDEPFPQTYGSRTASRGMFKRLHDRKRDDARQAPPQPPSACAQC